MLIEDGILTRENLDEALSHQKKEGGLIGQILVRQGYITEDNLLAALGRQLNLPYLPLMNYSINPDSVKMLEERFCKRHMMLAFDQDEKHLYLAVADPFNTTALEEIKKKYPLELNIFLSTPTEISNMIDMAFNSNFSKNKNPNPNQK